MKQKIKLLLCVLFYSATSFVFAQTTINYPRGNKMYCEISYLMTHINGSSSKGQVILEANYPLVVIDPQMAFQSAVSAAKNARIWLWEAWKKKVEELENDKNKKIDRIAIQTNKYWTDKTLDRDMVSAFIRNYVSEPGNNAGGVPSSFIIVQVEKGKRQ